MTPAMLLRKAAEIMHSGEAYHGACGAITIASNRSGNPQFPAFRGPHTVFREMLNPRNGHLYWFGGGLPQYKLAGAAKRNAREDRTYALLLAACVAKDRQ